MVSNDLIEIERRQSIHTGAEAGVVPSQGSQGASPLLEWPPRPKRNVTSALMLGPYLDSAPQRVPTRDLYEACLDWRGA